MIILDTHIWVWWVHGDARLGEKQVKWLEENEADGLGVSAISCWEVAKLVEYGRLALPCPVADWFDQALAYPESGCSKSRPASHSNPHSCPPDFTAIRPTKSSSQPPEFMIALY
jgi:hypothetical protein